MGIYSGNNMFDNSVIYKDTLQSIKEDNDLEPLGYDDDIMTAGMNAIYDIHENYSNIMQRIGISELSSLEQTGEEMVYTEGVVSSIYNTIKNFLKKIWEKIKALFKRFMMIIDSYTKNDKEFLNKYRSQILSVSDLSDFTFKGYNFSRVATTPDKGIQACETSGAGYDTDDLNKDSSWAHDSTETNDETKANQKIEKQDKEAETARGRILNEITKGSSNSKLSLEEFKKELREWYRNGETSKTELDSKDISVHTIISELSTSAETKKNAEKTFRTSKKTLESEEKKLNNLQKAWFKDQPQDYKRADGTIDNDKKTDNENKGKAYTYFLKECTMKKDCMIAINTVYLEALKDRSRQNKSIAVKIVAHKPKKESAYTESYNGNDFLANIELK